MQRVTRAGQHSSTRSSISNLLLLSSNVLYQSQILRARNETTHLDVLGAIMEFGESDCGLTRVVTRKHEYEATRGLAIAAGLIGINEAVQYSSVTLCA